MSLMLASEKSSQWGLFKWSRLDSESVAILAQPWDTMAEAAAEQLQAAWGGLAR